MRLVCRKQIKYSLRQRQDSIIFGTKQRLKDTHKLDIRRNEIDINQHKEVKYLGCILDSNTLGEDMAIKVLNKVNSRLRFLYRKQGVLRCLETTSMQCVNSASF